MKTEHERYEALTSETSPEALIAAAAAAAEKAATARSLLSATGIVSGGGLFPRLTISRACMESTAIVANPHAPPELAAALVVPVTVTATHQDGPRIRAAQRVIAGLWPSEIVEAIAAIVRNDPCADWVDTVEVAAAVTGQAVPDGWRRPLPY